MASAGVRSIRTAASISSGAARAGVPRSALEAAYAIMWCGPGVRSAKQAVAFATPEAANLAETMSRILLAELHLGVIDPQFPLRLESGRVAWCDLRVGCHVFEFH